MKLYTLYTVKDQILTFGALNGKSVFMDLTFELVLTRESISALRICLSELSRRMQI